MKQKLVFSVAVAAAVMLSSCGKKLGQFSSDYFSVNPNPLEVVGEKVPATVTGKIPANFFVKNATVTVTPYLVFNGTELASQSYAFQGEKVRGNAPVVSYEYGGTVTIPVSYKYQPALDKSELYLAFTVDQGGKQYVLPRVKVANGVVATAALADAATVNPALAPDAFQRVINQKYAADIMFLINKANLRPEQLKSDAMNNVNKELVDANKAENKVIKEVNIKSYASPDGTLEFNTNLAAQREKNTKGYMEKELKKNAIKEFGEITAEFTPEDWEGLQKLVAESDLQDKKLILDVLSMYKDPEQREKELQNLIHVYETLPDIILPKLRYSRVTAVIDVIGKSDEQIVNTFNSNPSELTVEEILYAASLTDDNNRQQQIYAEAAKLYPNDYRTWNDLGMAQYRAGKYNDAKASFAKAAQLAPAVSEPQMNLGLVELLNGNYSNANKYFGAAGGQQGLGEALGTYYLKMGDNAAAARSFGDVKSNNAALAQILTKNYTKAKSTLAGINKPAATTYYLMAVLGARTNNENMLTNNLRQAVKLDNKLAQKALNDLEFANFNLSNVVR